MYSTVGIYYVVCFFQAAGGTRMAITGSLAELMTCLMYLVRALTLFHLISLATPRQSLPRVLGLSFVWHVAFSSGAQVLKEE
jgi:hypothetical protein